MFALELDGLEDASARLEAYPAALTAALSAKAAELADALADMVRNDKLSGGVLNAQSGALRDSIVFSVSAHCAKSDTSHFHTAIPCFSLNAFALSSLPA